MSKVAKNWLSLTVYYFQCIITLYRDVNTLSFISGTTDLSTELAELRKYLCPVTIGFKLKPIKKKSISIDNFFFFDIVIEIMFTFKSGCNFFMQPSINVYNCHKTLDLFFLLYKTKIIFFLQVRLSRRISFTVYCILIHIKRTKIKHVFCKPLIIPISSNQDEF